jgi:hypothetical protein
MSRARLFSRRMTMSRGQPEGAGTKRTGGGAVFQKWKERGMV